MTKAIIKSTVFVFLILVSGAAFSADPIQPPTVQQPAVNQPEDLPKDLQTKFYHIFALKKDLPEFIVEADPKAKSLDDNSIYEITIRNEQ